MFREEVPPPSYTRRKIHVYPMFLEVDVYPLLCEPYCQLFPAKEVDHVSFAYVSCDADRFCFFGLYLALKRDNSLPRGVCLMLALEVQIPSCSCLCIRGPDSLLGDLFVLEILIPPSRSLLNSHFPSQDVHYPSRS